MQTVTDERRATVPLRHIMGDPDPIDKSQTCVMCGKTFRWAENVAAPCGEVFQLGPNLFWGQSPEEYDKCT